MKKIVVLSASPRKGGNSDILCDQFVFGAEAAGHRAEKIFVAEKRINHCFACSACQGNGGRCIQQDDMAEILDTMIGSDVIVMATPVYFYTMNGQMKTLIDRSYARYTEIGKKEMYFIVTAAVGRKELLERTIEGFRGYTSCLNGAEEKGIIYGTGVWNVGDIEGNAALTQAYEMGKNA